ncbi:MAG: ABC transporter permease [Eubacteriales bacterium]|nr:ABC transporter permease [Eubacteriales bacterium]
MKRNTITLQNKKTSLFTESCQRIWANPGARVGVIILAVIVILCVFAPVFAPYGVNDMDLANMYKGPSREHIFGTDGMGRDLFSRILYGGRYSLALGICAAFVGSGVGAVIGSVAGYFGKRTETLIMRFMDIWSSIPGMLLCILISATLGSGFVNTVIALAVGNVPTGVRLIRGQILSERSREYLEAAESINCSKLSIMFRHLFPNVISPVIVDATMGIGMNITMAASLSFIGLGVQPPTPEWGAMLADARAHILTYPYLIMFPGIVIALTVLAINLIGDGLRDAMDPKLRK